MTNQAQSRGGDFNTTPGASSAGQNTPHDPVRETADQAKEAAGQVAGQAKEAVGQVTGQAKEQVTSRLAGQKDRAAQSLGSVAEALRMTGQQLREHDQTGGTLYIDRVASEVERLSGYLERNDVGQLVGDVEQFARRRPALFLGGAFVLGVLGARFLKSTSPQSQMGSRYPLARRDDMAGMAGTPGYGQEYARAVGTASTYRMPTDAGAWRDREDV